MRVVWFSSAALVVGIAATTLLLPRPDDAAEVSGSCGPTLGRELGPPPASAPALPALRADPPVRSAALLATQPTAPPEPDELARAREELAFVRAELQTAQMHLGAARARIQDLLQAQCVPRFDAELAEWLDGPLAAVHEGDPALRDKLTNALEAAAWVLTPQEWDPVTQEWVPGACPEPLDSLRQRYPANVVAELATLFREWRSDTLREPRVEKLPRCAGDEAMANVIGYGQTTRRRLDDPVVQSILDEKQRSDLYWRDRVNSLLGIVIYPRDTWRCSAR